MVWECPGETSLSLVRGTKRRRQLASLLRLAPGFALVAVAGFALGGCGGGGGGTGAVATRTGLTQTTVTRAPATRTAPTRTTPTQATPTQTVTTTQTATTAATTTETATTVETTTETATTATTTTATRLQPPPTTAAAADSSSGSSTPWGWIALGLGLLAALVIGLLLWRSHRAGAAEWGAQSADHNRRSLIALDDVLAKGSVVTGQIEALAAEARSLETRAPDDPSRAAAGQVRERLDELARTLETDRTMRLSSPPPSAEQVTYSTALVRQQVEQLQGVLRPPGPSPAAT